MIEKQWFTQVGYPATVIMNELGFRCGYVGILVTHPLAYLDYNEETNLLVNTNRETTSPEGYFDVHGGLSYSGNGDHFTHFLEYWWFGFDCGHYGDSLHPDPARPIAHLYSAGKLRTLDYVAEECENLAKQLKFFAKVR